MRRIKAPAKIVRFNNRYPLIDPMKFRACISAHSASASARHRRRLILILVLRCRSTLRPNPMSASKYGQIDTWRVCHVHKAAGAVQQWLQRKDRIQRGRNRVRKTWAPGGPERSEHRQTYITFAGRLRHPVWDALTRENKGKPSSIQRDAEATKHMTKSN